MNDMKVCANEVVFGDYIFSVKDKKYRKVLKVLNNPKQSNMIHITYEGWGGKEIIKYSPMFKVNVKR